MVSVLGESGCDRCVVWVGLHGSGAMPRARIHHPVLAPACGLSLSERVSLDPNPNVNLNIVMYHSKLATLPYIPTPWQAPATPKPLLPAEASTEPEPEPEHEADPFGFFEESGELQV